MNSQVYRRKASSFRGVYRCGKKWKSQIQIDGVQYYLGVFPTEDRAAEEYRIAAKRLGKSDDAEYSNVFKEYAEGESESEYNSLANAEQSPNCNGTVTNSQGSGNSRSNSYNQVQPLATPSLQYTVSPPASSIARFSSEDNAREDIRTTSFYLIPTNQLSLISSKVKLGKLGEEILALSRNEDNSLDEEEGMDSNVTKLIALRSALFHSLQHIRNHAGIPSIQPKCKQTELADDENMYEV